MHHDTHPPGLNLPELRQHLLAEREALQQASRDTAEARRPVDLEQTSVGRLSRMGALQQQAMAQATDRRKAAAIQRIDAALARMEGDDYGWCATCGEPIAPRRLELDPAAPECIACASNR